MLVLLSGRMWVRDVDGARRDVVGPTWVVWYVGEAMEYGTHGDTVHWVVAQRTAVAPVGLPRPGSLIRLVGADEEALLVGYLDDTPDQSGTTSFIADVDGSGTGIYPLTGVVEVVEKSDPDLHDRVW